MGRLLQNSKLHCCHVAPNSLRVDAKDDHGRGDTQSGSEDAIPESAHKYVIVSLCISVTSLTNDDGLGVCGNFDNVIESASVRFHIC